MNFPAHFSYNEMIKSDIAERLNLDNEPHTIELRQALSETAQAMEAVRSLMGGNPIYVTSGYRSPQINALVGGAKDSDHMIGRAVDFICPFYGPPAVVCSHIRASTLRFSKLIYEYSWVHLSFVPNKLDDKIVLTKARGENGYMQGIVIV